MKRKDTHTAQQEKATRKRTRRIGSQERTRQSKAWTLREYGGKTLWDWMDLLIVPVMLALVTVAFTLYQDSRQTRFEQQRADSALKAEEQRADSALKAEEQRAASERKTEEQRAQDAALQAYLDQMSTLLLKEDLRNSGEDSEVRTLARARTATVIQRLDAEGNRNVIRFLDEAGLAKGGQSSPGLLAGVDLRDAHLETVDLVGTDLSGANLIGADLSNADLSNADLSNANLGFANLSNAILRKANLSNAIIYSTNLRDANLSNANLVDADDLRNDHEATKEWLEKQNVYLKGAVMSDGSKHP